MSVRASFRGQHRATVRRLMGEAHQLYRHSKNGAAAKRYEQAEWLAESSDDWAQVADARCWQGIALHGLGRPRAALATFDSALRLGRHVAEDTAYLAVNRSLRVLVELPLPLPTILRALEDTERRLEATNPRGRRSRLLLLRAHLALSRGRYAECVTILRNALEHWEHESHRYSLTTHLWPLVLVATWLRKTKLAREVLEQWESREDCFLESKRVQIACRRADLARCEGRVDEAVEWAGIAAKNLAGDEYRDRLVTGFVQVRSLLLRGECQAARGPLGELLRMRHTQVGEHDYAIRVLQADYHLSLARRCGGLPMIDAEFRVQYEPAPRRRDVRAALTHLTTAERVLGVARRRGERIDALLDCGLRSAEIAARGRLIRQTRRALEALP